jgi:hypothetical protein
MKVVLLRVGVDTGADSGGIYGPLFADGSFEFIPIPDGWRYDERTYGNTFGRHGRPLVEYFPESKRRFMARQPMHVDPEFETYTYGDPTRPKAGLRNLESGDMVVFYAGLKGWDFPSEPALYIVGYFEVARVGKATDFSEEELYNLFGQNFHVRHPVVFADQKDRLVLVKGSEESRLLEKARQISAVGRDKAGKPLKVLSEDMREEFGGFGGQNSIQRSPPRWVPPEFTSSAAKFVRSLE